MRSLVRSICFPAVVLICAGLILAMALNGWTLASQSQKPEGDQPYTPTKLEWLELELNSWTGYGVSKDFGGVGVNFEARPTTNTVIIWIRHAPDADPENIKKFTRVNRNIVERRARKHGWSDWLQIEVR